MNNCKRTMLAWLLAFVAVSGARAESFVFQTETARLLIGQDGVASSLIDKQNGKEQLRPGGMAFVTMKKGGHMFPASNVERREDLLHVMFGASGVSADYRMTASADYIVVQLVAVQGDGVEQMELMQLNTPLANVGGLLGVRWDENFAICLMGLSEQVDSEVSAQVISASVYPEFSMQGQRVAIIAAPTPRFLDAVQKVEHDFGLPSPTIGATWAKGSDDARSSYLFTDLTEVNADQTIQFAKMGGFRYILIYSTTWSTSIGSYPINAKSFPHGEAGLKAVIDKCHAAGVKVGMHMLTSLVAKNDALAAPTQNAGLLKESETTLAADLDDKIKEVAQVANPPGSAAKPTSNDMVIDGEIIRCGELTGTKGVQCQRGFAGTKPSPHKAGAKIQRLAEGGGAYLADLRSSLTGAIAQRVAGVINGDGFDMVYFDGGELNRANGPAWYWVGVQQSQIWAGTKRDLLVQGSGATSWTWHILTRGTCDDYAAVAVKQYLDHHKIAGVWSYYHDNFLPAELGWVGFLQDAPDHPATTPDELEYYAVRSLALGSALSLETSLSALQANGRSAEMLKLLGQYEQLRLSGNVPKATRDKLTQGEWHMTTRGEFHPIRYDAQRIAVPGEVAIDNQYDLQPLKFRLQVVPQLTSMGNTANIPLLRNQTLAVLRAPSAQDLMPGALIRHIQLSDAAPSQSDVFMVSANDRSSGRALDLTTHRALAIQLDVEGSTPASGKAPVLNLQLEAGEGTYRDYYIDLDFRGAKTIVLPEPGTSRMLDEFPPPYANYPYKAAMHSFNYANIVALNLRWMRYSKDDDVQCKVSLVEALAERKGVLKDVEISTGKASIAISGELSTGDYAEYWGDGPIRVFDRNGVLLRAVQAGRGPLLSRGENKLVLKASDAGSIKMTAITQGK